MTRHRRPGGPRRPPGRPPTVRPSTAVRRPRPRPPGFTARPRPPHPASTARRRRPGRVPPRRPRPPHRASTARPSRSRPPPTAARPRPSPRTATPVRPRPSPPPPTAARPRRRPGPLRRSDRARRDPGADMPAMPDRDIRTSNPAAARYTLGVPPPGYGPPGRPAAWPPPYPAYRPYPLPPRRRRTGVVLLSVALVVAVIAALAANGSRSACPGRRRPGCRQRATRELVDRPGRAAEHPRRRAAGSVPGAGRRRPGRLPGRRRPGRQDRRHRLQAAVRQPARAARGGLAAVGDRRRRSRCTPPARSTCRSPTAWSSPAATTPTRR